MSPTFTSNHPGNSGWLKSKPFGDDAVGNRSRRVFSSNAANSVLAENRPTVAFTWSSTSVVMTFLNRLTFRAGVVLSSFGAHIVQIVLLGASKQMCWIHAVVNITGVTDKKSGSDALVVDQESHAMRRNCSSRSFKVAISVRPSPTRPEPAFTKFWSMIRNGARFVYELPKPLDVLFGKLLSLGRWLTNFVLHSITFVNCLPRLRMFVHRAGIPFSGFNLESQV